MLKQPLWQQMQGRMSFSRPSTSLVTHSPSAGELASKAHGVKLAHGHGLCAHIGVHAAGTGITGTSTHP